MIIQRSVTIHGNSDKAVIKAIFSELEHYILQHFAREEALMRICYGAITNHQGHIEVQSALGKGAAFHIYLPLQAQQAIAPQQQPVTAYDVTGKLILLADDQPYVLEIAQQVLEAMSYKFSIYPLPAFSKLFQHWLDHNQKDLVHRSIRFCLG